MFSQLHRPNRDFFSRATGKLGFTALLLVLFAFLSIRLGASDLIAGDEGYYGLMARNILSGSTYTINPSHQSPLGEPGDKPMLYPLILAGAIKIGGVDEIPLRLVTLFLAVVAAPFLFLIADELGFRSAGKWAVLIYLTSSLLARYGRVVRPEVLVMTLGLAGIWVFLRSFRSGRPVLGFLAGCLFGLGFLTKYWLILPPIAAVSGLALVGLVRRGRESEQELPFSWRSVLAAGLGFFLAGSTQLLLCWIFTPEYFEHWLRMTFGFSLSSRVGGEDYAVYWLRPWYLYVVHVGRLASPWLPAIALGIVVLFSRLKRSAPHSLLAGMVLFWLLPLLPMSVFSVKSGHYMLPMIPGFLLLAGLGFSAWGTHMSQASLTTGQLRISAALAAFFCIGTRLLPSLGTNIKSQNAIHIMIQLIWIGALLWVGGFGRRLGKARRLVMAGCVVLTVVAGLAKDWQVVWLESRVTGFQRLAERLEPGLRELDPKAICFISPGWPSLGFYTYRAGKYWETSKRPSDPDFALAALRGTKPFFFVVATGIKNHYGGVPDPVTLSIIEREGYLFPPDSSGEAPTLQVYLNEPLWRAIQEGNVSRGE